MITICDVAESADGKEHDYTLLFQLDTTNVVVSADGRRVRAEYGEGKKYALEMEIGGDGGERAEAVSGRLKPSMAGWFVGRDYLVPMVRPATTVFVKVPRKRTHRFKTILRPIRVSALRADVETAGPDTWAAEDALGRKVGLYSGQSGRAEANPSRKEVLLFYWTWHDNVDTPGSTVKNITNILRNNPGAMQNGNLPCWKEGVSGNRYFWDEPLFGYYKTWDSWVLRKHAEMLAAVGVDAVFFDCTNGAQTWDRSTEALMATWDTARPEGGSVPQIAFLLPFSPGTNTLASLRHLYKTIYGAGRYSELWYRRDGKPCIMAYPDSLTKSPEDEAIRTFFTFRPGQPDYVRGPWRDDQWGWLENYPQHPYRKVADGRPELVTVGVAQNACPATKGHCSAFNMPGAHSRSFTKRRGFDTRKEAYLYGANFCEQWDRAYELNPDAVFVTGWNEWVAGMWTNWQAKPFSFVDEFDADRSRDIEPVKSWGDRGDVYYLQFADRVRQFKGMGRIPRPSGPKVVRLDSPGDWDDVSPRYIDSRGDIVCRDAKGYCETHYTDTSGRNDIVEAKVARDGGKVYFRVKTFAPLTSSADRAWMTLFVDTDRSRKTGWQGYDLVVNRVSPAGGKAVVERSQGREWKWGKTAEVEMAAQGDALVLALPRSLFGDGPLDFEFKWGDNLKLEGDVMDFYVSGDVAPLGRFNFIYCCKED